LIVEDNPMARTALEKLLALKGFHVQSAGTLQAGQGTARRAGRRSSSTWTCPTGTGLSWSEGPNGKAPHEGFWSSPACEDPAVLARFEPLDRWTVLQAVDLAKILEHLDPQ
jgi:hypothetical protein